MSRMLVIALLVMLGTLPASAQIKVEEKKAAGNAFVPMSGVTPGSSSPAPTIKARPRTVLPGEVEVHFLNGSVVRMILQSDKLAIATPYGQLSVPCRDIRTIDFGLHFPDGMDAKIQQAIKSLGANNFRDRDEAGKTLVDLGPYSYAALLEASRSEELETSRRAKDALKQLEASFPKKDLKLSVEDRIVTPSFTIAGRILTPTIKAKAELFGDVELPVARMRTIRALFGLAPDIELTIDAAKYASANQWLNTEFDIDGRSSVVITAKGMVDVWPQQGGQYIVGPNGLQGRGMGGNFMITAGRKISGPINGQAYGGMLIGKIGESGEPFTIGERYEGSPETQGKLYLHIGPSPWNAQASGSYEVKVARKN